MKHKIWIISIVLAFCGFNVHSQTRGQQIDSSNTYVVSKQDLVTAIAQLLKNAPQRHNEQGLLFQERELRRLFITKQLMQNRMQYAYPQMNAAYPTMAAPMQTQSNGQIEHRLATIENQLNRIATLVDRQPMTTRDNTNATKLAFMDSLAKALATQQNATDTSIVVNNTGMGADSTMLKMLETLVAQNQALKDQLSRVQQPATTAVVTNHNTPQYTGELDKVFFAHNSAKLNANGQSTIQNLVEQMKQRDNLQVMVKGFASQVGGSVYNQELSLKRTDAVKFAIVHAGIDPGRVLSAYYGEDMANDEAYARRVEILYINSFVNK